MRRACLLATLSIILAVFTGCEIHFLDDVFPYDVNPFIEAVLTPTSDGTTAK